jgi:hypothetical protein
MTRSGPSRGWRMEVDAHLIPSPSRALQILVELGKGKSFLTEFADKIGVYKSTVWRMLHTFEGERFVHHNANHRHWLGSRLFALADMALEQHSVRDVAATARARSQSARAAGSPARSLRERRRDLHRASDPDGPQPPHHGCAQAGKPSAWRTSSQRRPQSLQVSSQRNRRQTRDGRRPLHTLRHGFPYPPACSRLRPRPGALSTRAPLASTNSPATSTSSMPTASPSGSW